MYERLWISARTDTELTDVLSAVIDGLNEYYDSVICVNKKRSANGFVVILQLNEIEEREI